MVLWKATRRVQCRACCSCLALSYWCRPASGLQLNTCSRCAYTLPVL
jgi:hypothetical protein